MHVACDVAKLVLLCMGVSSALGMDLATLLKARHDNQAEKRKQDSGNPCPDADSPFPCKGSNTCIPMGYLCDDSWDCEDGYDEDKEVCTAVHRPPVVDILHFLDMEKSWILPNLFGKKSIGKIAHGLAVSQTVDDFKRRLNLSSKDVENLRTALEAVKEKDVGMMADLGMPVSAWQEVNFIFSKLIKSGFA